MTQIPFSGSNGHHAIRTPKVRRSEPYQHVILVADDEPVLRNMVTSVMQQESYFVLSAGDGLEALELSRQYPGTVDLLITDIDMPGMNGHDLCSRLTEERPAIKTLIVSGGDATSITRQNAKIPFLPKPFDGKTLIARVRSILSGPFSAIP